MNGFDIALPAVGMTQGSDVYMCPPQPPNVELLNPMALVSKQLEVIPCNTTEPPTVAPHPRAPRSPALSSDSKLFSPDVNMNAPEYPDEPEYTLDIKGVDNGPSSV
jgi:hypothetical protein